MARIEPPFHAPPAGPLTAEPLVEFNEQYDVNVEGRWDLNDWSRVPSFAKTFQVFRDHAVNAARYWHDEDAKARKAAEPQKPGPRSRYPDNAPPGETPDERRRRKLREAQARFRERHGAAPPGTRPPGRPRKDAGSLSASVVNTGKPWSEAQAAELAHMCGFAGTSWHMGPEELVHVLNMAGAAPPSDPT